MLLPPALLNSVVRPPSRSSASRRRPAASAVEVGDVDRVRDAVDLLGDRARPRRRRGRRPRPRRLRPPSAGTSRLRCPEPPPVTNAALSVEQTHADAPRRSERRRRIVVERRSGCADVEGDGQGRSSHRGAPRALDARSDARRGFVAGTYVLTDTLEQSFDDLFSQTVAGIDLVVRLRDAVRRRAATASRCLRDDARRHVPLGAGCRTAHGVLRGYAQFVDQDGDAIQNGGAPTLGITWSQPGDDGPLRLIASATSRRREGPDEVAMDVGHARRSTASRSATASGPARPARAEFRIVGPVRVRRPRRPRRGHLRRVRPRDGAASVRRAAAASTRSTSIGRARRDQRDASRARIAAAVGIGVRGVSRADVAAERSGEPVRDFLDLLTQLLLGFAAIGARGRRVHHLQHVHDPRRATHPRARAAARDGRERATGGRLASSPRRRWSGVVASVVGLVARLGLVASAAARAGQRLGFDVPRGRARRRRRAPSWRRSRVGTRRDGRVGAEAGGPRVARGRRSTRDQRRRERPPAPAAPAHRDRIVVLLVAACRASSSGSTASPTPARSTDEHLDRRVGAFARASRRRRAAGHVRPAAVAAAIGRPLRAASVVTGTTRARRTRCATRGARRRRRRRSSSGSRSSALVAIFGDVDEGVGRAGGRPRHPGRLRAQGAAVRRVLAPGRASVRRSSPSSTP